MGLQTQSQTLVKSADSMRSSTLLLVGTRGGRSRLVIVVRALVISTSRKDFALWREEFYQSPTWDSSKDFNKRTCEKEIVGRVRLTDK